MPFEHDYGDSTPVRKSDKPPHVVATSELDVDACMLRESVKYFPDTGNMVWKVRPRSHFATEHYFKWFNKNRSGKPAFATMSNSGYLCGGFSNKMLRAHRVAWLCFYGEWPNGEIDHINRDRSDNRISNLRVASRIENSRNKKSSGVHFIPQTGKWRAQIGVNGKSKHLGTFYCFGLAILSRRKAELEYGYRA